MPDRGDGGAGDPGEAVSLEATAVGLARALRSAGLAVPTTSALMFLEALAALDVSRGEQVYWAARATMLRGPEDLEMFDRAFRAFWLGSADGGEDAEHPVMGPEESEPTHTVVRWSAREVLRQRDFAHCTPSELEEAHRLMRDVRMHAVLRRSRRLRPSRSRRGRRPDLRRTLRSSLRTGGDIAQRAFLEPGSRPRRVVLLCDVSGSMEPYSRAVLRFLHVAVAGRGDVEAFTLGTRLTRVTRELRSHDPDAALARATAAVDDWTGGTRLGAALQSFNDEWGVRGVARGAVVVIVSDGWDCGDPGVLAEQVARMRRVARRLVWVNPLKASPGFEPLARGMAAALPHVDELLEGHSLAALEDLAEVIAR